MKIRNDSLTLKQYGHRYRDYLRSFNRLISQVNEMSETDKIMYFTTGLRRNTQVELQKSRPQTLDEAITIASSFEVRYTRPIIRSEFIGTHNNNTYQRNDNKPTDSAAAVQKPVANTTEKGQYNYKQTKQAYPKQNNAYGNSQKMYGSNQRYDNHSATKTYSYMVKTHTVDKLITVSGFIDCHPCQFILDTGANISIISEKLVKQYEIKLIPKRLTLQIADGNAVQSTHKTAPLRVDVHGSTCVMELIVHALPNDCQTILGLDWFKQTRATIDPTDKILTFKAREVCLETQYDTSTLDCLLSETSIIEDSSIIEEDIINEEQTWSSGIFTHEIQLQDLTRKQKRVATQFLKSIDHMFAKSYADLGCCINAFHEIKTLPTKPIFLHAYRKSFKERELIKVEIQKMLDAGIIRPSKSPWSFPVVLIEKKDGSVRFCVDYRKLNAITLQDQFPLPRIDDILDRLAGSIWFTTIDLKSGYWQVRIHRNSIAITAFSTPDGHYEFLRLPFGLKNAPADFSRIMYSLLGDLPFVQIYLDDTTVHSSEFDTHITHLKVVITRLQEINLKINGDKCQWFQRKMKILGHIVTENTVLMDKEKINAVEEMKPPRNIKQLQQYLGLCNYYRRFIEKFSFIAAPLYGMLKKDMVWNWTKECQNAFDLLKTKLIEYPILRQPDLQKPFIIFTDASTKAIGAVLSQKDKENKEFVCAYASRLLKGAELHYGITDKECLAVLWAVKHFRVYLYGSRFTVITDHSALTWLMSLNEPTGRLARWSLYLQTFTFEVIHRKGLKHSNVDVLSRPVMLAQQTISEFNDTQNEDAIDKDLDPMEDNTLLHFLEHGTHRNGLSKRQCKRIQNLAKHYYLNDGKLWYRNNVDATEFKLLVPPKEERTKLVERAHLLGHFQSETTLKRLQEKYYWHKMKQDVESVVRRCQQCKRHQEQTIQNHPAMALPITGIFDRIGMDLVFGLPETKDGYKGILVITEYLSKYPYAVPIRSKTAEEIAKKLFLYISIFGPPKTLLTDQGKEMTNAIIQHLSKISGIERRVTAPYHPRTNGLIERFNHTLITALRKHTDDDPENWPSWIPYVLMAYRTRIHSVTGQTPFSLIFGREMNEFQSWETQRNENEVNEINNRALELKQLVENSQPNTIEKIEKKQEKQKAVQDKAQNVINEPLKPGTQVYIRSMKIQGKLEPKFHGPYTVQSQTSGGNYKLVNSTGTEMKQTYPRSRLKIVANEANDSYEIEKILDHRNNGGKLEYFVKWIGYPMDDCSWVKESNFDTTEIIEDYWNKLNQPALNLCITKTNQLNLTYISNLQVMLFVMMILMPLSTCQMINGDFKLCDTTNKVMMSKQLPCQSLIHTEKPETKLWHIFHKRPNKIDGDTYVCKKYITKVITYTGFFGSEYIDRYTEIQSVNRGECEYLVDTKKCGETQMTCMGNTCTTHIEPNPEFAWLRTVTKTALNCIIYTVPIHANDNNIVLFEGVNGPCRPKDLQCKFNDGVVIWSKVIIHECPLIYIASGYFVQHNDVIHTKNKIQTTMKNEATHLLFQLVNNVSECNIALFSTSEGLYVSNQQINITNFDTNVVDPSTIEQLTLADNDYTANTLTELNQKISNTNNQKQCFLFQSLLRTISQIEDAFHAIHDLEGNDLIIYSLNHNLYLPRCITITNFTIVNGTEYCFDDFPVMLSPKTMAFLTPNGILRKTSKITTCQSKPIETNIQDKYLVRKTNTNISITMINATELYTMKIKNNEWIQTNYQHNKILTEQLEYFDLTNTLQTVDSNNQMFHIRNSLNDIKEETFQIMNLKFFNASDFKHKLIIFSCTFLFFIFLILALICMVRRCCHKKQRQLDIRNWLELTQPQVNRI